MKKPSLWQRLRYRFDNMMSKGTVSLLIILGIITTIVVRLPLSYLLAALTRCETWPKGRPDALFASLLISWVLGMIITVVAHRKGAWRRRLPEELQKL